MRRGAIILCGGKSSRMGRDKATLPFGPELMLQRIVRLVGTVIEPDRTIVVAAPGQELPPLPEGVITAYDDRGNRGPLEGIAAGLRSLMTRADAAFVTGCDAPLIVPEFIERIFELLGDYDVAVPREEQFLQPLAAVYRTTVINPIQQLLDADQLSPRSLFERVRTLEINVNDLRTVDPDLKTLMNLNRRQDYLDALAAEGFEES